MKGGFLPVWDDKEHKRIISKVKLAYWDYKKELMKDLEPCPFCGWDWKEYPPEFSLEEWTLRANTYRVVCTRCGAAGPDAYTLEWAVANWNNRGRRK
jgi:hypothetical protein